MMYVFKDNTLIRTVNFQPSAWSYLDDVNDYNQQYPKAIPTDSYVFLATNRMWYSKRTRKRLRLEDSRLVPKELKVILLLLGVPL